MTDCQAACWDTGSRIAFSPYPEIPLVKWNLDAREQTLHPTPERIHGSSALTVAGEGATFFGPYGDKTTIFEWTPGREPVAVGTHPGPLRGLRGGRFVGHGKSEFTILERCARGSF